MADHLANINRQLDAVERLCASVQPKQRGEAATIEFAKEQCASLRKRVATLDVDGQLAVSDALHLMARLFDGATCYHWRPIKKKLDDWQQKRKEGGEKGAAAKRAEWDLHRPRLRAAFDEYRAKGFGPHTSRGKLRDHHKPCPSDKTLQRWGFKD